MLYRWLTLALVVVAGLLAIVAVNANRDRAKAEGAAAVYAEQLATALDSLEQSKSVQAETDARAAVHIAAANARAERATARADAADRRRPAIIDRVVAEAGPDSAVVREAVEEVADSIVQNEVEPLRAALEDARLVIAAKDLQLTARDRVNQDLQRALDASTRESAALRSALPGWFSRNAPKVAVPAAIAVGWVLRDKIGG